MQSTSASIDFDRRFKMLGDSAAIEPELLPQPDVAVHSTLARQAFERTRALAPDRAQIRHGLARVIKAEACAI